MITLSLLTKLSEPKDQSTLPKCPPILAVRPANFYSFGWTLLASSLQRFRRADPVVGGVSSKVLSRRSSVELGQGIVVEQHATRLVLALTCRGVRPNENLYSPSLVVIHNSPSLS